MIAQSNLIPAMRCSGIHIFLHPTPRAGIYRVSQYTIFADPSATVRDTIAACRTMAREGDAGW